MSDWQQAFERDKHKVGRAVHEAWAAEKQRQHFADHPHRFVTAENGMRVGACRPACDIGIEYHHPDMLDYDDLASNVQEYAIQTGIVGYRMGYEAAQRETTA